MTRGRAMVRGLAAVCALMAIAMLVRMPALPVWGFVLLVLALALPVTALGAGLSALRRGHWLLLLAEAGWLRWLLSGAPLRVLVHAGIGLALAGFALMRMMVMDVVDSLALLAGAVVAFGVWRSGLVQRWFVPEVGAILALRVALWIGAAVSVLVVFALLLALPPEAGTLVVDPVSTRSALVGEVFRLALLGKELEGFVLRHVAEPDGWSRLGALVYVAAGVFSVAWVVISVLGVAVLPGREGLRGLAPASVAAVAPGRGAVAAFGLAAAVLVTGLTALALREEARLGAVPGAERPIAGVAHLFAEFESAELIDGRYFGKGAMAAIEAVYTEEPLPAMITPDQARADLAGLAEAGFDAMVANVDGFLDAYYSLRGEYGRIAALPFGKLEAKLRNDLTAALTEGDPFAALETRRLALLAEDTGLRAEFEAVHVRRSARVQAVLDRYRIDPADLPPGAILDVTGVFTLPTPEMPRIDTQVYLRDVSQRMQGGAVVGTVVAALVVRRIVGKGVLRLAAQAVAKAVAARGTGALGGTAAGAAGGAAIGTAILPGPGTVIGVIIGGGLGFVGAGIATDYVLLTLEEYFRRDAFRAEIVDAIEAQRAAVLAQIGAG
ncbi:MAG: hypothetical protein ACK4RN_03075 [Pseudorhodobacter sp.]